jgi:hypothetical protein
MARQAVVKNNKVVNVIVADDAFGALMIQYGMANAVINVDANPQVGIGWTYNGGNFVAPVQA